MPKVMTVEETTPKIKKAKIFIGTGFVLLLILQLVSLLIISNRINTLHPKNQSLIASKESTESAQK